jgi:predicted nucleic acid-binding protein
LHVKYKLPYADCFAAALSKSRKAQLVTGDRDFALVELEIEVRFL